MTETKANCVKWAKKVEIKTQFIKTMPLKGLQARGVTGMILGFWGYRVEVISLLQVMSHGTRAYIVNAKGLPGFLVEGDVAKILHNSYNELQPLIKFQIIDLNAVVQELSLLDTQSLKLAHLKKNSPCLYLFALRRLNRVDEADQFMQKCKEYQFEDQGEYSQYIHGYWLPLLEMERSDGLLKQGSKYIMNGGNKYLYTGEIDELGGAYGFGVAVKVNDPTWRFEGTFNFDAAHGICKQITRFTVVQVRLSKEKCSEPMESGGGARCRAKQLSPRLWCRKDKVVYNVIHEDGKQTDSKYITADQSQAFYDGIKARRALAQDWNKYL